MQAHAHYLRVEVANDWAALIESPAEPPDEAGLDDFVHQAVDDPKGCALRPAVHLLLAFVEKMTRTPAAMTESDVEGLAEAGWSERAIHDATQVSCYFNYINRIADALGVDPESGRPTWGRSGKYDHREH